MRIILKNNEDKHIIRVLLDYEVTISGLNKSWGQHRKISTFERTEVKIVKNFARKIEPDITLAYTYLLRLQQQIYVLVNSFEIEPTDIQCNAILSFW
jgi:hypothetical protein